MGLDELGINLTIWLSSKVLSPNKNITNMSFNEKIAAFTILM